MKVAIIEPHLVDYTGHYYSFVSELKRGFEELGDEVEVFLPRNSKTEIPGARYLLPPVPLGGKKGLAGYLSFFREAMKFRCAIKIARQKHDLLVFTTAEDKRMLDALATLSIKNPVILYFHTLGLFWDRKLKSIRFFDFLTKFKKNYHRLYFLSALEINSGSESLQISPPFRLFPEAPYPVNVPDNLNECHSKKEFLIAYLGAPAKQKNFEKFYEVIDFSPEDFGFIVQCNLPTGFNEPKISDLIKSLKEKRRERVILLESSLSKESYFSALKRSSIVWCLYDPHWYQWCISAILLEAWLLGKPVITTSGTWMAKQVEKFGGGLVLEHLDTQEILRGIERIRADYARFSAEAQAAGNILYEKNNGLALARFIKQIISE